MSYEKLEGAMNKSASHTHTDVVPSESVEEQNADARSEYKEVRFYLDSSMYPKSIRNIHTDG